MTRRRAAAFSCLAAVASFGFLSETGWLSRPRPWPETSGWRAIPADQRPSGVLPPDGPRIAWLGHSGFLVEWRGVRLLLDPNLSARCKMVKRLTPAPDPPQGPIDAVLISHGHYDHFDLPTLQALPDLARIAGPRGLDGFLPEGLRRRAAFTGLTENETLRIGPLRITAVAAKHRGGRWHPFPSRYAALGYVIDDGDRTLYYAGDTAFGDHFAAIGARFHPDIAILPIGSFEPRFALAPHHLSPEEAVKAAQILGAGVAIPCHFGTFRLAFDRPDTALPRFARAAARADLVWAAPAADGRFLALQDAALLETSE